MAMHIKNMFGVFGRGRHLALLISLLLLFLISPFVAAARYGTVVINTAGVIVLLSGIYAMSEQRRLFVVTLIGSVAAVATNLLMVVFQSEWIAIAWHGFTLLLLGLFSVGILEDVLRRGRISAREERRKMIKSPFQFYLARTEELIKHFTQMDIMKKKST